MIIAAALVFVMSKLMLIFSVLVFSLVVFVLPASMSGATMTLRNTKGADIQAEILSVDGDELTIRRQDGSEFTFGISMLDEASRRKTREWALNHIPSDAFDVTIRDRPEEKEDMSSESRKVRIERIQFHFDIEYNHNIPLQDLRIEYRVFYSEERMGRPVNGYSREVVWTDEIKVPLLEPEAEIRISSEKMLPLEESRMHSGWSISRGFGGPVRDRIDGIWMRLYRGDKLLHEHSEPSKTMDRFKWDLAESPDPFSKPGQ